MAEVTHLVEAPTLVIGRFDESLLELPPRLLVQTMKQNQRYFPTFKGGELHSEFVIVSNNPTGDHDLVADGNAAVILARFDDARPLGGLPVSLRSSRLASIALDASGAGTSSFSVVHAGPVTACALSPAAAVPRRSLAGGPNARRWSR